MEEIIIDLSQVPMTQEDLASLEELISRSKTMGPQIGIPWNEKVYDYMFESGAFFFFFLSIFGDYIEWDPEEDDL